MGLKKDCRKLLNGTGDILQGIEMDGGHLK
jgi:hypothetical protein